MLYDMDVTMYDQSNTCTFEFKSKRVKLFPCPPKAEPKVKSKVDKGKSVKDNKTKALHIIGTNEFEQEIKEEVMIFALVTKDNFLSLLLSTLPR